MQEEIWKDVPGYENYYQVSDQGNVRSLDRMIGKRLYNGRILSSSTNKFGYKCVVLYKNSRYKNTSIHKLVAMTFLGHKPNGFKGLVVDHIDNNPLNNNVSNLQLISNRENTSKDKINTSSIFTGVGLNIRAKKWESKIKINGKSKHLGYFTSEIEASQYYQDALKAIENGTEIKVKKPKTSSKYKGVSWSKQSKKWAAYTSVDGKKKHLGYFNCELAAVAAYQKELIKLNK